MNDFVLGQYPNNACSILVVYSDRKEIELAPDYQRIGGIWTREKRQLLIDSVLNGFDIPKFYFHMFMPPVAKGGQKYRYAIIDGKQRLQAIWDFIDGKLALATDFIYLRDEDVSLRGLTYGEIAHRHPEIKARFDGTRLDIVTIHTSEIEVIEDLFSRLNEAVPLNAPEKRNAFGGPWPRLIREIGDNRFFVDRVPFSDNRYRYRDLAAKFLYIESSDGVVNTKKADLDRFVRQWAKVGRAGEDESLRRLKRGAESTLELMSRVFRTRDGLLRQVGMITLYYYLFRFVKQGMVDELVRDMLQSFEKARGENRARAERTSEADDSVDPILMEFDSHSQTPNDAYALRDRLEIVLGYMKEEFGVRCRVRSDVIRGLRWEGARGLTNE